MTGSVHDAEDVVQETYLRAWLTGSRFGWRWSPVCRIAEPSAPEAKALLEQYIAAFENSDPALWGGEPYGVIVLILSTTGIARINSFGDPGLVSVFGFPGRRNR